MSHRFLQILSITLAWTVFVTGSLLPALHRHDESSCCGRVKGSATGTATGGGTGHAANGATATECPASSDLCHSHAHPAHGESVRRGVDQPVLFERTSTGPTAMGSNRATSFYAPSNTVGSLGGDLPIVSPVDLAGSCVAPSASDTAVVDECSICRFLGQSRVTLTGAAHLVVGSLSGRATILAVVEPELDALLVARSRGPPVLS